MARGTRRLLTAAAVLLLAGSCFGETADAILTATGTQGGLVVHIGCGRGELVKALAKRKGFLVHGLDGSPDAVRQARKSIQDAGVYGRASVMHWRGGRLPYAENMVNLCIADELGPGAPGMAEVMRVLVPRGVAYIQRGQAWKKTVKPWPRDIDEWTHWLHAADGNAVARDRLAGPPRRIQWMARPLWARLHDAPSSASAQVSANGRVFYIADEGPAATYEGLADKWSLVARDAFNGVLLWKRPMPDWGWKQWTANWHARNNQPFQLPKRLVAVGDTVYVTLAFNARVTALNAATGEVRRTCEGTEYTDEILVHDGLLILGLNDAAHKPSRENRQPIKKSIAVLKAATGEMLWKKGGYTGVNAKTDSIAPVGRLELAVGGGRVYCTDRDAVIAMDLATGKELWRTPRPGGPQKRANFNTHMYELCVLVYQDDVVLLARPEGTIAFHTVPGTLYAFDAKTGKLMWKKPYGGWVHNTQPNVFVINGIVWVHEYLKTEQTKPPMSVQNKLDYAVLGLDLVTGEQKHRYSTRKTFNVGHHHRCYRNKATERFLLTSRRGVEFLNISSGAVHLNHWVRGDCHLGVMPCNGMLYSTPHPCGCYIDTKLNGYYCLAPASKTPAARSEAAVVQGPAYGKVEVAEVPAGSWPTFRGDAGRSGSAKTRAPTTFDRIWEADLGGNLAPVTVARGKVFVPVINRHRLVALDEKTGKWVWDFTAGGRVDTPPTIYRGMAMFGSADGRVYCLRCRDGRLVWSRRVAPADRLIGAMGQVESSWPVHGSVLVQDDVAYVAAGRSSYLDGGISFYALRPATGEVVKRKVVYSADPKTDEMPPGSAFKLPGMLADILVGQRGSVWMRGQNIFGDGGNAGDGGGRGVLLATGGFRDDTWFNRTTWSVGNVGNAQLLVHDGKTAYTIAAFSSTGRARAFTAGDKGYRLSAVSLKSSGPAPSVGRKGGKKFGRRKGNRRTPIAKWSRNVPVRGTAMAVAGGVLFVAGAPDRVDPSDPLGAFEGRKGMVLCAFGAADGKQIRECPLASLPVWDGMAAAAGRLYLATQAGHVLCIGK